MIVMKRSNRSHPPGRNRLDLRAEEGRKTGMEKQLRGDNKVTRMQEAGRKRGRPASRG